MFCVRVGTAFLKICVKLRVIHFCYHLFVRILCFRLLNAFALHEINTKFISSIFTKALYKNRFIISYSNLNEFEYELIL